MIIECPNCQAKFKIDINLLTRPVVKMRCGKCTHIFEFGNTEDREELSQIPEDDKMGSQQEQSPVIENEKGFYPPKSKTDKSPAEPQWLDQDRADKVFLTKKQGSHTGLWLGFLLILICAGAGIWFLKDNLFGPGTKEDQTLAGEALLFNIPKERVTYEVIYHPIEGSMLVIRGITNVLTEKPANAIQIQARVYDRNKNLLGTSESYAGIVLDEDDLTRLTRVELEALLGTQQDISNFSNPEGVPFVVILFGDMVKNSASFQVEVINWT